VTAEAEEEPMSLSVRRFGLEAAAIFVPSEVGWFPPKTQVSTNEIGSLHSATALAMAARRMLFKSTRALLEQSLQTLLKFHNGSHHSSNLIVF